MKTMLTGRSALFSGGAAAEERALARLEGAGVRLRLVDHASARVRGTPRASSAGKASWACRCRWGSEERPELPQTPSGSPARTGWPVSKRGLPFRRWATKTNAPVDVFRTM